MPPATESRHDVIEIGNEFYIRAQSSLALSQTRVLLHNDTFAVFDQYGDLQPYSGEQGIFHRDTRYLSKLELRVAGVRPLLLSSAVRDDNVLLSVDLTNPDLTLPSGASLPRGTLHVYRGKFLSQGVCVEKIAIHNFSPVPVEFELSLQFGSDFSDIFEVRGQVRPKRGTILPPETRKNTTLLSYCGLDNIVRRTRIECSAAASTASGSEITVPISLAPQQDHALTFRIACETNGDAAAAATYDQALSSLSSEQARSPVSAIDIYTSNEQFNDWVVRSRADLQMLVSDTAFGTYPYAGVPWFATAFGRDGIITALQVLWVAPALARGVLNFLAATQATSSDVHRDSEPGKILHETRQGEMAVLGEVPFGRYYGSVDSTPLFVLLAGAYYERTGDLQFLRSIWPNITAALEWIDGVGDSDGDGFVEYSRQSESGLLQQGWKDSQDSVFHADGEIAQGPIALCEVQAYVYAAKTKITRVAVALGHAELAHHLSSSAEDLRNSFNAAFWCDDISMFALALDGDKRQCRVHSSNAGQCLFSDIASPAHARLIKDALLSPSMFSGWGVRTLATHEHHYNPMSYHNGSVWPHDNSLIALGDCHSREKHVATRILSGLLDLSIFTDLHRLPELICGFPRRQGKGATLYPVACSPQAWASGAVFLILQSCLGLTIDAQQSRINLYHPALPESIPSIRVRNIQVGDASIDLSFERHAETVAVNILRRQGEIEVVATK